ncbi:hypothetical protein EVAR_27393_1 [Eumeta japonica]|uniref:Uncharacterized protein n=1 Tax=Eumeta variegata TaxID=151549 RepID=A0A4C1X2I2_EUMVA|nr:hypothetical protein EVAR_27393_1 [Eumeta japonica]
MSEGPWEVVSCPENMRTTSFTNACTCTPNSLSSQSKEFIMRFQKVGPAMESCIQPLEVLFLDSPPEYHTTTSRSRRNSPHHALEVHWAIIGEQVSFQGRLPRVVEGTLYVQ